MLALSHVSQTQTISYMKPFKEPLYMAYNSGNLLWRLCTLKNKVKKIHYRQLPHYLVYRFRNNLMCWCIWRCCKRWCRCMLRLSIWGSARMVSIRLLLKYWDLKNNDTLRLTVSASILTGAFMLFKTVIPLLAVSLAQVSCDLVQYRPEAMLLGGPRGYEPNVKYRYNLVH